MPDAFQAFAQEYAHYGYPVLFVGVLLENMGIPLPGETAVLAAGVLSSPAGGGHFRLALVIAVTTVAAILGDNLGFWLGEKFARPRLAQGKGFLFLNASSLKLAEGYFHKYGTWTVFFARFFAGLRIFGALAAGTSGMPWHTFFLANAAGALVWASAIASAGYFFGSSWEMLHLWLGRGSLILLACAAVLVGLPLVWRHFRQLRADVSTPHVVGESIHAAVVVGLEAACIALLVMLARGRFVPEFDRQLDAWIAGQHLPWLDAMASVLALVGSLPGLAGVVAIALVAARRLGRPRRESVLLAVSLLASEAIGLLLVGLLHYRDVELSYATVWPYGFVGLIPMRATTVFGAIGILVARWRRPPDVTMPTTPPSPLGPHLVAGFAAVMVSLAVVWLRQQTFTETLLDCTVGGVLLYASVRWLDLPRNSAVDPGASVSVRG